MDRVGLGSDLHRLEKGHPLIVGGVRIPADLGAVGHSDADVLFHAITDAILGALALGDIGSYFPDSDDKWKNANSLRFLEEAVRLMDEKGFEVGNVDSVVHLEKPKIGPFADEMRSNIAAALGVENEFVSIKAKTGEGLGAIGESRAIKADACVLLRKI